MITRGVMLVLAAETMQRMRECARTPRLSPSLTLDRSADVAVIRTTSGRMARTEALSIRAYDGLLGIADSYAVDHTCLGPLIYCLRDRLMSSYGHVAMSLPFLKLNRPPRCNNAVAMTKQAVPDATDAARVHARCWRVVQSMASPLSSPRDHDPPCGSMACFEGWPLAQGDVVGGDARGVEHARCSEASPHHDRVLDGVGVVAHSHPGHHTQPRCQWMPVTVVCCVLCWPS